MPPITSGGFNFYDPTREQPLPGFQGSQLYDWQAELNRRGYFANFLGRQGLLGMDNKSDFARSLQDRFDQGYQAWQMDNPDAKYTDYLDKFGGDQLGQMVAATDPATRGIDRRRMDSRWLPRSG